MVGSPRQKNSAVDVLQIAGFVTLSSVGQDASETAQMSDSDLPKIGAPATRALASIGITQLAQVADRSEPELLALHGFGPRALRILRDALSERGLSMRP